MPYSDSLPERVAPQESLVPGNCQVWSPVFDHLTGRAARVAAQAAVITAVVGGTVGYVHSGKDVTLVLDGTSTAVQTSASDVRGLLAGRGLTVTDRDLVAPGLDTSLADGQQVVVRFARPFTVSVDGTPRAYWTTELTVDDALVSLGIRSDGAKLSASRSQPLGRAGLAVAVSTPKRVTVVADGRTRQLTTTAARVADLVREQGISVRPADRLSVLPTSPVVDGQVVALTRIDRRQVRAIERVASSMMRRPSVELAPGREEVVSRGRAGSRSAVYTVVLADGKEVSRTLTSSVIVQQPVAGVVRVGTRKAESRARSVRGADGLNWAALARCESGGNPRAVNPAGYYGLYQFSRSTWRSVGGSGMPHRASPAEQLHRAKLLYARGGAGQWGCGRHLFD